VLKYIQSSPSLILQINTIEKVTENSRPHNSKTIPLLFKKVIPRLKITGDKICIGVTHEFISHF
jgi:hypothetical protein